MKPTVLFLFNHSTYALQPWIDDGRFNVVTVSYTHLTLPTKRIV